ncbi:phage virion morphogenesis protein [Pseudomonas chlororaphis]|uniref:phage virion morphogenesis protein n=1 Tax=Pseudomonas chlororaphis TaxID=587753 RepID=UPI001B3123A6|nr:phage virion morphogenesis protein [Pseudomonas chlororaphis]MBP5056351.1 phage virion morphogenesis protein [Pseudomonas chlororaphis]MBP5140123.1 phage virion morphogenesis protein [Pseudomonas chlororaphis]QTT98492.1 phage virion morphogenesis protein [Pseudomonas chlororaphis]
MTGAMLDVNIDESQVGKVLDELVERLGDLTTPLNDIAEYLHQSTDNRFAKQVAPDGSPWAPLAPSTLARKKGGRILRDKGTLQDTMRHSVSNNELTFGTDRPYGAIHQFGGKIEHAARSQRVYFRQGKDGSVGNRFISKRKSNFAQWVSRGAHVTEIEARPYLGLSSEDDSAVLRIVQDYLQESFIG